MRIGVRGWLLAAVVLGSCYCAPQELRAQEAQQLTEQQLGLMIEAIGLKPSKQEQRYDFAFQTELEGNPWEFSMSAVLSQDGESIWVMAWLDELPKSSAEVPRSALLKLLAANDRLGNGKFFAYIPANRRFVLQRVISNEDMTSAKFRLILQDLAISVMESHPEWSVAGWTGPQQPAAQPQQGTGTQQAPNRPTRTSSNEGTFEAPIRQ